MKKNIYFIMNNEKKIKKIFWCRIVFGLLPKLYCEEGKLYCKRKVCIAVGEQWGIVLQHRQWVAGKLYCNCNTTIVLQDGSWAEYIAIGRICIARLEVNCRLGKAVSRYKNCIVNEVAGLAGRAGHCACNTAGLGRSQRPRHGR